MALLLTIAALLAAVSAGSAAEDLCPEQCYCAELSVDCANGALRHPPVGFWPDCKSLDLQNSSVTSLNAYSLTGFPDLEMIYLEDNGLTVLDLEVFAAAPNILHIGAEGNPIETIAAPPPGMRLSNLKYLFLRATAISALAPDSLRRVAPSLQTLSIDDTPLACDCLHEELFWWARGYNVTLHEACDGVSQCPFLPAQPCPPECSCEDVEMHCNDAALQDPPVGLWMDYGHLDVSRNTISALYDYSLTGFPNVIRIDLHNNELDVFDLNVFVRLQYLEYLDLSSNSIDSVEGLPEGLELSQLQTLSLAGTKISSLDIDRLGTAMPSLTQLNVDDTPLACDCAYTDLYIWSQVKSVELSTNCNGENQCTIVSCPADCECEIGSINCWSRNLTEFPSGHFPWYTTLFVDENMITTVDKESLEGYTHLQYVNMDNNELTVLDLDVFSTLRNLNSLFFRNNKIESILAPSNGVQLEFLLMLNVGGNSITSIDTNLLESAAPSLETLDIQDTPLACECNYQIIYWWAQEKNVTLNANCKGEETCYIPLCPSECKCEDAHIDCWSLGLTEIPPGYFPGYQYLYIEGNNISTVDREALEGYRDLQHIYMDANTLTVLDLDAFSILADLSVLSVSNNEIQSFLEPSNGAYLRSLNTLNVGGNDITSIDTKVLESAAPSLQNLDIHDTPLACECGYEDIYVWAQENDVNLFANCNGQDDCSILPCPSGCECQVIHIDCSARNLSEIPPGNFPGYTYLYIENNYLTTVDKESLEGYKDLQYVDMHSNGLTVLDLDVFSTLTDLSSLFLSNNNIESILEPSNGAQLKALHTLDVGGNNISSIDTNVLESAAPELQTLHIHDTPLACDCDFEEMYFWAQEKEVVLHADCDAMDICSFTPAPRPPP